MNTDIPIPVYLSLLAFAIMAGGIAHARNIKQPVNGYYIVTVALILASVIINALSPYRVQGSNGEQIAMYERCMSAVPVNSRTVESMNICQDMVRLIVTKGVDQHRATSKHDR